MYIFTYYIHPTYVMALSPNSYRVATMTIKLLKEWEEEKVNKKTSARLRNP
jgi:hypothetical protein